MKVMNAILHEARLLLTAVQFLTRVPIPRWVGYQPEWLQGCLRYFPVVGSLIGLAGALALALAAAWWPPAVAVVLSMACTVWLTGSFHEDGWADTCDALGGTVSRERALEIMKDSRIGTYGSVGLILMLGLKAVVLVSLSTPLWPDMVSAMMALIWCHTASRLVPVWLIRLMPYGGDAAHAKAKPLAMQVTNTGVIIATLLTLLLAAALWGALAYSGRPTAALVSDVLQSLVVMAVGAAFCAHWFMRRLGGFTGDTLGASQQITEVLGLLTWLMATHTP